ncbi:unnamed protein product [Vitrella brassicaformis CCMP3155]|uniref:Aminotransferase class I/classII large domain-containing protein n=1 Tax=Vitrella brassicaformis (strain CCMP3155) TaxID=1169540 RepID=A0A0G4H530_VITBC|nr:unnamed protein product [Vitrella brassicaformis CCMP3155]|eukprot:CEM38898.1 unnamed protein product [Vitrella brassicaformis CCMP3155]
MVRYGQYDMPPVDQEVNFKVGQPSPDTLLPLDLVRQAANAKFAETDHKFLQYGDIQGYLEFRKSLAGFLTEQYGAPVSPDELMVTNGITGGLALFITIFCRSGDLVFAEEPSYFLALRIFEDFKLNVVQIPMDEDGIIPEELEKQLQKQVPKFLYTIPIGHNPTGRTLAEDRRKKIVELAYKYSFVMCADEVYHLLGFSGVPIPLPMPYYDQKKERVVSLRSFSKILAPALRLGWMQGPMKILKPIIDCGQLDSSGGINPVISGIVHQAIDLGLQKKHLAYVQEELHRRCNTLMSALDKYMPAGVTHEVPKGGYFVLVKLPEVFLVLDSHTR